MSDENSEKKTYELNRASIAFFTNNFDGINFIILDPEELLQVNWVIGHYYEKEMIDFIRDNYKGGSFVDAGSCIGNHSIAFSKVADHVYSFEPVQATFLQQVAIIFVNKIRNITTYNLALGNKYGLKPIFKDNLSAGGGRIGKKGNMTVSVVKLDDFKVKDVKLIKVDVEGYELEMLKGSKKTILKHKPDLFIECATDSIFKDIWKFVNELDVGYRVFPKCFNATPTFLFTTRSEKNFRKRVVEKVD